MKLFVTSNWPPDYQFGGVVYSGSHLFNALYNSDPTWKVIATGSHVYLSDNISVYKYLFNGKYAFSIIASLQLLKLISKRKVSFVFVNGTVTWITMLAQLLCLFYGVKYVVSTRGALEPWRMKHKYYKKKYFFKYLVLPLLYKSRAVHVTGHLEKLYVSKLVKNKIIVSPNGSHNFQSLTNNNYGKLKLLFLSRISEEKGLDILEYIAQEIANGKLDVELTIVGPGAVNKFKSSIKNVNVFEGVYGEAKIELFKNCDIFLLPSYSENFGNVILESLSYGRPVITTSATPWNHIDGKYGWIVEPNKFDVAKKIKELSSKKREEITELGYRAAVYAKNNYSWKKIGYGLNKYLNEL